MNEAKVKEVLSAVIDPALGADIVGHRIYNGCEIDGDKVLVKVAIPTPAYPQDKRRELATLIETALKGAGAKAVTVVPEVVTAFQPAPSEKALLKGPKNVIAVAAGKGGVGKSTVATNLALALHRHGARVGLLDADVFGPSIPTMLGPPERPPGTTADQKITPAIHHGIEVISVGFFVDKGEAVVWRGPMVHRLLQQFLGDVQWGELDYLVCDLPPGTGDVQLSLSQLIPITGSVMVTTPQEVSIVDVVKGIAMFEKVEIPILGIVENMSYYVCPACGHHDEIFSHGGGKRLAQEVGAPFLGEIAIDTRIRFGGDAGVPIVMASPDSQIGQNFMTLASTVALRIAASVLGKPKRSPRLAVIK
ncbi:MAG: Mrp/NBP35 family ATP-binding protein [Kofleriaceae bacterium]|nr:MAG: Mrp/NBP35 family ATP-binding protein [Kofleriaceae bacterium]MBZ0237297.1 Mrp/NBP35 family ATP-binding protein [Kofleriaceae bacterium]